MLPVLPVVLPLFTAALLAALTKLISQRLSQIIAIATTLATLAVNVSLLRASAAQPIMYWFGGWRPRHGLALGISFAIDPIGAGLATFVSVLMLAAFVFSSKYFDTVGNHFHALLLAFLAAMCGFCLTGDMFNMFVFFELMSAAAFALCGYKTEDPGSLQGALNFAVTNTIGAYFVLSGIGLLYARTGALNMAQMGRALGFRSARFSCVDRLRLHRLRLSDQGSRGPVPLLARGCSRRCPHSRLHFVLGRDGRNGLVRSRANLLGRLRPRSPPALARTENPVRNHWSRHRFRRRIHVLLAAQPETASCLSTISHVGLMTVGIGLFTPEGLAGAAVYTLGHGMVKAALFLVAGILLHRFKTVDECDLHAKGRRERWTAAVYFAAGIALAGLPFTGLAAGDDLMHASADSVGFEWIRWVSLFAGAVTSAAVLRAGGRIFFGWGPVEDREALPEQEEKPKPSRATVTHPPRCSFPLPCSWSPGYCSGSCLI